MMAFKALQFQKDSKLSRIRQQVLLCTVSNGFSTLLKNTVSFTELVLTWSKSNTFITKSSEDHHFLY